MARPLSILLGLAALGATTRPAEPPPGAIVRLNTPDATFAGFSADGESMYLVARLPQFDLWSLVTYHWPELLLAACVILAARALFRTLRRTQDPLHDYCRKCNYSLHALAADACPECGLRLTPGN